VIDENVCKQVLKGVHCKKRQLLEKNLFSWNAFQCACAFCAMCVYNNTVNNYSWWQCFVCQCTCISSDVKLYTKHNNANLCTT
jgi:hypothetical protein